VQKVISNPGFTLQLERCRAAPQVDYAAVTSLQNERVRSEEATRRLYDDENRDEKKEGLS
jgi:hypothetical protein